MESSEFSFNSVERPSEIIEDELILTGTVRNQFKTTISKEIINADFIKKGSNEVLPKNDKIKTTCIINQPELPKFEVNLYQSDVNTETEDDQQEILLSSKQNRQSLTRKSLEVFAAESVLSNIVLKEDQSNESDVKKESADIHYRRETKAQEKFDQEVGQPKLPQILTRDSVNYLIIDGQNDYNNPQIIENLNEDDPSANVLNDQDLDHEEKMRILKYQKRSRLGATQNGNRHRSVYNTNMDHIMHQRASLAQKSIFDRTARLTKVDGYMNKLQRQSNLLSTGALNRLNDVRKTSKMQISAMQQSKKDSTAVNVGNMIKKGDKNNQNQPKISRTSKVRGKETSSPGFGRRVSSFMAVPAEGRKSFKRQMSLKMAVVKETDSESRSRRDGDDISVDSGANEQRLENDAHIVQTTSVALMDDIIDQQDKMSTGQQSSKCPSASSFDSQSQNSCKAKASTSKTSFSSLNTQKKESFWKQYYQDYHTYAQRKKESETSGSFIDFTQYTMDQQLNSFMNLHDFDMEDERSISQLPFHKKIARKFYKNLLIPINDFTLKIYGSKFGIQGENKELMESWQTQNTLIIHPLSNFRTLWDLFMIFMLLVQMIFLPISLVMFNEKDNSNLTFTIFNLVTDAAFFFDIYINLRTGIAGVLQKQGSNKLVHDVVEIRSSYMKFWFWLDLISTIPFEVFAALGILMYKLLTGDVSDENKNEDTTESTTEIIFQMSGFAKTLRLWKMTKFIKVLRVAKMTQYVKILEQRFHISSSDVSTYVNIIEYIFLLAIVAHLNAIILYALADTSEGAKSWVAIRKLDHPSKTWGERYLNSLFKAFSHMICIGYGMYPPIDKTDLATTQMTIVIGALLFGLFLGNMISTLHDSQTTRATYQKKTSEIQEYMQFRKLPAELRDRITYYFEQRYEGSSFQEKAISSTLNPLLRKVIQNYTKTWLLQTEQSIFRHCSPKFQEHVAELMKFQLYSPDDIIFDAGRKIKKAIFIEKGLVTEYLHLDNVMGDIVEMNSFDRGACLFGRMLTETYEPKIDNAFIEKWEARGGTNNHNHRQRATTNRNTKPQNSKFNRPSQRPSIARNLSRLSTFSRISKNRQSNLMSSSRLSRHCSTISNDDSAYIPSMGYKININCRVVADTAINCLELDFAAFRKLARAFPEDREIFESTCLMDSHLENSIASKEAVAKRFSEISRMSRRF